MTISEISTYMMPEREGYPNNKADWQLERTRAVLLILDMQRYFLSLYDAESELIKRFINNLVRLRSWAHQNNVPVIYTVQHYEKPTTNRALLDTLWGSGLSALTIDQMEIIDQLSPTKHDIVLTKCCYSAFKGSDLLERMQGWNRDQLIVGGVYAHSSCMVTAIEAYMSDIQPFLVGDAIVDYSEDEHRLALKYVSSYCGQVLDTDTIVQQQPATSITKPWLEQKVKQLIGEDELDQEENLILYGLDSLRIMQFSSELKALGIDISFEELGGAPTLSNWWSLVDARQKIAG